MNINDYILKEIKALTLSSTVKKAQKIVQKFTYYAYTNC
jgi:hypothetical protein